MKSNDALPSSSPPGHPHSAILIKTVIRTATSAELPAAQFASADGDDRMRKRAPTVLVRSPSSFPFVFYPLQDLEDMSWTQFMQWSERNVPDEQKGSISFSVFALRKEKNARAFSTPAGKDATGSEINDSKSLDGSGKKRKVQKKASRAKSNKKQLEQVLCFSPFCVCNETDVLPSVFACSLSTRTRHASSPSTPLSPFQLHALSLCCSSKGTCCLSSCEKQPRSQKQR